MAPIMRRVKDAAAELGLGEREVRRLIKEGELDIVYVGKNNSREYRVLYSSMQEYVASLPSVAKAR